MRLNLKKKSNFFSPKTQFADKEQKLAAEEGIFAFHTCKHNQSLNSMDCTSQLVRKLPIREKIHLWQD